MVNWNTTHQFSFLDDDIFPLEFLRAHRYPNGSTIVLWQHVMVASVTYYTIHFRSVVDTKYGKLTTSPWRDLANIRPEYFSRPNLTKPLSYLINGFLNTSSYEVNLAIVNNKTVLVSVSILVDPLQDTQRLRGRHTCNLYFMQCNPKVKCTSA